MYLPDTPEHGPPVRPPEVRRRPQPRDRIAVRVRIVDHDIGRVVRLDLRRQVRVDLDVIVHVLGLDGEQQAPEPLETPEVAAHPEEVHLAETRLLLRVVHPVPDGLENRGERRHADARADEDGCLVFEDVFGGRPEGPVDVDARKHAAERWVDTACVGTVLVDADDLGGISTSASRPVYLTSKCFADSFGEVAHHTDVNGDVVLLGRAGECERMILP